MPGRYVTKSNRVAKASRVGVIISCVRLLQLLVRLQWAIPEPPFVERATGMALTLFYLSTSPIESIGDKLYQNIMRRKVLLSCVALAAMGLASCSTITSQSGMGVLYTGVSEGQMVTSNELGSKVGTGSTIGVLGLVSVGDASIQTAAHSAGIKKISHVDAKKTSVLGLFAKYQILVYGE